jgi:hypothetical protein
LRKIGPGKLGLDGKFQKGYRTDPLAGTAAPGKSAFVGRREHAWEEVDRRCAADVAAVEHGLLPNVGPLVRPHAHLSAVGLCSAVRTLRPGATAVLPAAKRVLRQLPRALIGQRLGASRKLPLDFDCRLSISARKCAAYLHEANDGGESERIVKWSSPLPPGGGVELAAVLPFARCHIFPNRDNRHDEKTPPRAKVFVHRLGPNRFLRRCLPLAALPGRLQLRRADRDGRSGREASLNRDAPVSRGEIL